MLGTGKNSPQKNFENNGLVVNLNRQEETDKEIRPRKRKSWLASVKGFFAWLRPSDPAVDFIKNFEEKEEPDLKLRVLDRDSEEKSSTKKSKKTWKKNSLIPRLKVSFNLLPLRSYNTCQRNFGEIVIFL